MNFLRISIIIITLISSSCGNCPKIELSPCGGSDSTPLVDLVVIMDQSGSMSNEATAVSVTANDAIAISRIECDSDLRVEFLALDNVRFPNTLFDQSVKDYLLSVNTIPITFTTDNYTFNPLELGAANIDDISRHFDWRDRACRAIFYISDEPINGGTGVPQESETMAVNSAISSAIENSVAIFTNSINEGSLQPIHISNYERICKETGGTNYLTNSISNETYLQIMPEIICNSCDACKLKDFIN